MSSSCEIAMPPLAAVNSAVTPAGSQNQDQLGIGYLRAFVTLLVLAHHSFLAYVTISPAPGKSLLTSRMWTVFPVVDSRRSPLVDLFVGFNDVFFMSLMFLVSGLFVWNSLNKKGASRFANDRALRLGIPFAVAAAIVPLVAYYPAYLQTSGNHNADGFLHQWLHLGVWPAGPAWFIWVLLAFDCAIAFLYSRAGNGKPLVDFLACGFANRPARFFWLLISLSAAVYIPASLAFGPMAWTQRGPFAFQTARLAHYFVYFLAGVGLGMVGLERSFLSSGSKLTRHWGRWSASAVFAFVVSVVGGLLSAQHPSNAPLAIFASLGFVFSCGATCFAFLALFLRFCRRRYSVLDSFRSNAYGVYLIHYAFVTWLQYALLPAGFPALLKALFVLAGTVGLSWVSISLMRRVPGISRVL